MFASYIDKALEGCRWHLREALSDWIALRLRLGLSIPVVSALNGIKKSHVKPASRKERT